MFFVRHRVVAAFALFVSACGGGGADSGPDLGATPADSRSVIVRWRAGTDVAGYVLHWGSTSREYFDAVDVGAPEPDVDGVLRVSLEYPGPSGTIYFALTSYDANRSMSPFSNEIVAVVP